MCGIIGYIGDKNAIPILIDGLKRLEYRGYDSAGVVVQSDGNPLIIRKRTGKLVNLENSLKESPVEGEMGIE